MIENIQKPNIFAQHVDYQDTDAGGVVYHAAYVNFAERARGKLFRETFGQLSISQYLWVVKEMQVKYLSSAQLGDLIRVTTSVVKVTPCSVTFRHYIEVVNTNTTQPAVDINIQLVSLNYQHNIVKFNQDIREKLTLYIL